LIAVVFGAGRWKMTLSGEIDAAYARPDHRSQHGSDDLQIVDDGRSEGVDCEVSSVALDDLAGEKGIRSSEREAKFTRLRDTIERITSGTFDERGMAEGASIRILSIGTGMGPLISIQKGPL
jgi:hypothetical protein